MRKIAIFGAGGFGRELACLINRINAEEPQWDLVGFFDDDTSLKGKKISHYGPCLGGMTELNAWDSVLSLVVAVGSPKAVKCIVERVKNDMIDFPNIISPDFIVADQGAFKIGRGNIIQGRCIASCGVSIGDFNVLNGSVVLGHDVVVGSFNAIMPAVRISGEVKIGSGNFLGVGCIILQQIKIGDGVKIGAGSVLMTKPKDGCLYIGNPAKKQEF